MIRLWMILFLLVSGCAVKERIPVFPLAIAPSQEITSLIERLNRRKEVVRDLKALVRVTTKVQDDEQRMRYAIIVRKPAEVRVEVFPLNGFYTLSLLGVYQGSLISLVPHERRAYSGIASPEILEQILGMPVTGEELIGLVTAVVPGATIHDDVKGVLQGEEVRFLSNDNRVYVEMFVAGSAPSVIKLFDKDGVHMITATYGDYRIVDGVSMPHHITLARPEYGFSAELKVQNLAVNTNPPDSTFLLSIPEEYDTTYLE